SCPPSVRRQAAQPAVEVREHPAAAGRNDPELEAAPLLRLAGSCAAPCGSSSRPTGSSRELFLLTDWHLAQGFGPGREILGGSGHRG
ncbi:unnamed protein product, partial [Prorocentrum cordatum]